MNYSVVIVDDEPWSREVVKSLAQWDRIGLALVGEADDGIAGLKVISRVKPDIVITDMKMPGMGGVELLQEIANLRPGTRTIVMSGYDDFPYVHQALKTGAQDYLLKPVDPDELNNALRRCVQELERGDDARPHSIRAPLIFDDLDLLDEYIAYRRRAFIYLLELDNDSVRQTIAGLRDMLEGRQDISLSEELGSRIMHDFLLMLEEFVVRQGLSPDPELFRPRHVNLGDPDEVFAKIGRVFEEAIASVQRLIRTREHLNLADVKDHMDHYYRDPISLQTVARLFLVSKEHLSREFRKEFGFTVNDYLTRRRMETARDLIRTGKHEIKMVAELVGYEDLAYFYRVFKKQFGFPPGKARE